jgi:hypothetical protein|tara:strand:- start:3294 stop:3986 length:693 start_codon:yes stop_codon:yes gene_type:complete
MDRPKIEEYKKRIQRKIIPGDKRFNVNTFDFNIIDRRIFFYNAYCYYKKYDFILLDNKKIKIGLQHQHISKDIMDSVIGAGSLSIDGDGMITYLDNQSGTFQFNSEQHSNYLDILHSIVNLQNAQIFDINYTNYDDPVKPEKIFKKNNFHKPIIYKDELYKQYLRDISKEKLKWLLDINKFDHNLYHQLNADLLKVFHSDQRQLLLDHFKAFGQYEMGRCVGYYTKKDLI